MVERIRYLQQEGELCTSNVLDIHVDLQGEQKGEQELVLLI